MCAVTVPVTGGATVTSRVEEGSELTLRIDQLPCTQSRVSRTLGTVYTEEGSELTLRIDQLPCTQSRVSRTLGSIALICRCTVGKF